MIRITTLAVAVAAALGAASLSSTPAAAGPWGWGGHHHHHHHHGHWGAGFYAPGYYGGCYVRRWVHTPYGPRKTWTNVCY
jgi:hypothetical protein